jgi:hypothetical protein
MATCLTHLRVAEKVSDQLNISDRSSYFAGSIAPDTDMLPDISHWCINAFKTTCDAQGFYKKYISSNIHTDDKDFYYGYYIHLLTDNLWHNQKIVPLENESKDMIRAIKQKWRNVDVNFLADNEDFKPLMEMEYAMKYTSKYDKPWLDYYKDGQVKKLVESVIGNLSILKIENRSRDSATESEIEQFINECIKYIGQMPEFE